MKLSWSHKLFFKINNQIGKRPWLDMLMIFCARWLIWIFIFFTALWFLIEMGYSVYFFFFFAYTAGVIFVGVIISWTYGYFFPHRRPIVEFPKIFQLVIPLKTWKALPSDHAMISFILAGVNSWIAYGTFQTWPIVVSVIVASFVAMGRVYCGLHYPRDIVAGAVLGFFLVVSSYFLII